MWTRTPTATWTPGYSNSSSALKCRRAKKGENWFTYITNNNQFTVCYLSGPDFESEELFVAVIYKWLLIYGELLLLLLRFFQRV